MNAPSAFVLAFVGSLIVGAYLVVHNHPWFGLLVILIGACVQVTNIREKQ